MGESETVGFAVGTLDPLSEFRCRWSGRERSGPDSIDDVTDRLEPEIGDRFGHLVAHGVEATSVGDEPVGASDPFGRGVEDGPGGEGVEDELEVGAARSGFGGVASRSSRDFGGFVCSR